MNSRQLEYVITVAEEGSFSKAAKKLIISQPSLSQYIQKLENELGTKLFIRSNPLRLTFEGKIYVEMAKRILNEEKEMKKKLFDILNDQSGEVTIAAGPFNSICMLPRIIRKFQQKYPHVKVIIREAVEPQLLEILDKNECDVVFTTIKPDTARFPDYEIREIGKEDYLIAVSEKLDPLSKNKKEKILNKGEEYPEIDINRLKKLPFIFIENKNTILHRLLSGVCRKVNIEPETQIECPNISVAQNLVSVGAGISLVPSSAVLLKTVENIHYYRIKQIHEHRKIYLLYLKNLYMPEYVQHLIELSKLEMYYN